MKCIFFFFRIDTFKTLFPATQNKHSYQFLIKHFWSKKGQSQRMLEHWDVSQGELGQEAGCSRAHQNAVPTAGRCKESESEPRKPGRGALAPQSQAGNLCSRTDTELERSILWRKPRIKGRVQDSTDKMFKARTQRSHLQKWVRKRSRDSQQSIVRGRKGLWKMRKCKEGSKDAWIQVDFFFLLHLEIVESLRLSWSFTDSHPNNLSWISLHVGHLDSDSHSLANDRMVLPWKRKHYYLLLHGFVFFIILSFTVSYC